MHEKRYDIQGIRGWAVAAVVIFHFFPDLLPFGYLGVDVFFVLSGFLISLVLDNKPRTLHTYTSFNFKRIRRISPLAILVILICLVRTWMSESGPIVGYSTRSALYAMFYATNWKNRNEGEDYFRDLEKADDLYTHTWSLSVEIQFYLLAPILFHMIRPKIALNSLLYLSGVATLSLLYSFAITPSDAFSSTLSRLWQFSCGAVAYELQPKLSMGEKEEQGESSTSRTILLMVPFTFAITAIFISYMLGDTTDIIRVSVTVLATALLIYRSTSPLLCHESMQLLGDSSYSLYLIHWPVVCWLKEYALQSCEVRVLAIVICLVFSVLIYMYYEESYRVLEVRDTTMLIGTLYLASFAVILLNQESLRYLFPNDAFTIEPTEFAPKSYSTFSPALEAWQQENERNISEIDVKKLNDRMDDYWEYNLKYENCNLPIKFDRNPWGFCELPDGNGTLNFLVIGNSYAANHGRMIVKHFKQYYNKIRVHTVSECEPLIDTKNKFCTEVEKMQQKFLHDIEREKPDVLFLSSRFIEPCVPVNVTDVEYDPLYLSMMQHLKKYEAKVKKVFMLQAFPRPANLRKVMEAREAAGIPVSDYMEEAIECDAVPMRQRMIAVAKNCAKCVMYDINNLHLNEAGNFTVIHPRTHLHYFESLRHHTPIGLKLIEPLYERLAAEFPRLLESKSPENVVEWIR